MHRTATKTKVSRKPRAMVTRTRVGRRPAKSVSEKTGPLVRPANDVDVELEDMPEVSAVETVFASAAEELPDDLATLEDAVASVPPDDEDLSSDLASIHEEEVEEEMEDDEEEVVAQTSEEAAKKAEEPQSFLSMYFRDMAELEVLRPEQEFETARRIEELELGLWHAILSFAPWGVHAADTIEASMGKPLPEFKAYRALVAKMANRAKPAQTKKLNKVVKDIAAKLKELDIDRVYVDAAMAEIHRLNGAAKLGRPLDGLGFSTTNKAFRDFVELVSNKASVVKHAKNEFVKANLRLVVSIARRFNHGRLPLPDLIQEGNIGLMKAVERYDYRRGFRFSTYASWWIRHAISRALADKGRAVRLPVHMIDAYHRIAKSERELQSKLERPATTEEIASVTGIEAEKLEKMRTFLADNPVSLDRSLSDDDGRRLIDVLVDPNEAPSPPDQMMSSETQREMLKLLSVLKPIEADILRKRFGLVNDRERTLKEIGDEYRLSRERVRQLQEQALGKMRKAMAKREML